MAGKLYHSRGDPDILKLLVLWEVEEKATRYELSEGSRLHSGESGKYLTLVGPAGEQNFSSANDICRLACKDDAAKQFGASAEQKALVEKWQTWENDQLKAAVQASIAEDKHTEDLISCLGQLESQLSSDCHYLTEGGISFADIAVWSRLYVLIAPDTAAFSQKYPSLCGWFTSLSQLDSFKTAVEKDLGAEAHRNFILEKEKPSQETFSDFDHDKYSAQALAEARHAWLHHKRCSAKQPKDTKQPILPIPGERNILITSALPYVNNEPHLGNIIGCVLSADVFARYCRLRGYNTLYVCGTDEYGTATETKALEEGLTPQEICSKYFSLHDNIYKWFNIDFDVFGRTSTPQQTEIAQDIFQKLHSNGYVSKDKVDQLFCRKCERFLADRFVEGICPFCAYKDARGDQCDKCSRLINAVELKSPRCKVCRASPVIKTSNHLFLDLDKLQPTLTEWYKTASNGLWSPNALNITSTWLKNSLKPRCISRDLTWGTPVPLEGYTNKVFYVWFDAPIGYLSITACYTPDWEKWWKNPKEVQLYQFMAKDNVPFHSVVFPCSLLGTGDDYILVNHLCSTEYLNYEDGKFSKSRGVGVFGNNAIDTNIPADVYRFYLLYIRPETQDSVFNWSDFAMKNNTELLSNLGNFINRCLSFLKTHFQSTIQETVMTESDYGVVATVTRELRAYISCLENMKLREGLKHILAISRTGNGYIQSQKPWTLVKGSSSDVTQAGSVMSLCANIVCLLSVVLQPYMPHVSKQIQTQLNVSEECNVLEDCFAPFLSPGHCIGEPYPLFTKIEDKMAEMLKKKFAGNTEK